LQSGALTIERGVHVSRAKRAKVVSTSLSVLVMVAIIFIGYEAMMAVVENPSAVTSTLAGVLG
jgi:hypothetical protein